MSKDVEVPASAAPDAETLSAEQLQDADEPGDEQNVATKRDDGEAGADSQRDAAESEADGNAEYEADANGGNDGAAPREPLELPERVNALVKAILERLVPETQRVASSLAQVEQRTADTERRVSSINRFAQSWTDEILAAERKRSAKAFDEILKCVVYPMHDQLFTRICAMESGQAEPDPNLLNLMKNFEGCLDRIEVLVVRPQPGEPFDLTHMESMEAVPCRFFRRPDTVARVHRCGFAIRHVDDDDTTVIRKSLVDVYRKT